MSGYLWKYYFEDDVNRFRQLLDNSSYSLRGSTQKGHHVGHNVIAGVSLGSPGSLGASPNTMPKTRKSAGPSFASFTRGDINYRDSAGLTLLHHVASSGSENSLGFAQALLAHPLLDLYIQDVESGWTALHRAFYFGNIAVARLILNRDSQDLLEHRSSGGNQNIGGLIKIKDREGNGPFDLFALTIKGRTLRPSSHRDEVALPQGEEEDYAQVDYTDNDDSERRVTVRPRTDLGGDEVFTFGSNKNVTLGFGDEDDRQYPERINLRRPGHLTQRFHREYVESRDVARLSIGLPQHPVHDLSSLQPKSLSALPTTVRAIPLRIQDVHMSKLHTAVLTTDPESNLHMCGHGPGGRLGIGDEVTRYQFICVEGGAILGKKIVDVALGNNHTLAISDEGELFSWGSNGYGQLGYSLPKVGGKDEDPVQLLPRQLFGSLKKEIIVGVAASRIHSVVHSPSSLYTFGKNDGQLGIVDSDARSLEVQSSPRKIAASLFSSAIASVSAIERATICLLENHDVWVFANYGYAKLSFPLEGFTNYFLKSSFLTTKYDSTPNKICKVVSGGDTICSMSTSGEIFTVNVSKRAEIGPDPGMSTTNPSKIRGALSQPSRVWSAKKRHMAARDVGVDQDGSIILVTEEGSVWRRTKRVKIKDASAAGSSEYKPKDYKFSRIPGLTRVIAVRSSAHGAYAAVRKECDVTRTQIGVENLTIWDDIFSLIPFPDLVNYEEDSDDEDPLPRFWTKQLKTTSLRRRVLRSKDAEAEVRDAIHRSYGSTDDSHDLELKCSTSTVSIPGHQFIFVARSRILREGFAKFKKNGFFEIPEVLSLTDTTDGKTLLRLHNIDFLSMFDLVYYVYSDSIVDFWNLPYARQHPQLTTRYRQVRTELMRLASRLELKQLELSARQMSDPKQTMNTDFEIALTDSSYFSNGDITIDLSDGESKVHGAMVCQRCPFFQGLFQGRTMGLWLASRREGADSKLENVRVDLKHVDKSTFDIVLKHIYSDMGEQLFDNIRSEDLNDFLALDEFIDVVMDVMGVANELMLDRLSQICQKVIGKFVNVRNICSLLNAIAPSSVTEFKDAGLEYVCLNLEAIMQHRYLDELDEDLILELNQVVKDNQLAFLPLSRSGRAEASLFEKYPELAGKVHKSRNAKIDAIMQLNKVSESDGRPTSSYRAFSREDSSSSPTQQRNRRRSDKGNKLQAESPEQTPQLKGRRSIADLMFDMSDEEGESKPHVTHHLGNDEPNQKVAGVGSPEHTASSEDQTGRSDGRKKLFSETQGQAITNITKHSQSRPWGTAPLIAQKLDMRDIMAQAQVAGSQPSGLSIGLSKQRVSTESRSAGSFQSKMSQKERKKLQQIQDSPTPDKTPQPHVVEPQNNPALSPWQVVSPAKQLGDAEQPIEFPTTKRVSNTPHLTMRQTIANPSGISKDRPQAQSPRERIPSQPSVQQANPSQQIIPRSIRHTPVPQMAISQISPESASLIAILSQQQAEKDTIKEVVTARHDLRDIQREQEFQEWWDQESARVMLEEEERQRANRKTRGKGRSEHGRQKVKAKSGESETAASENSTANTIAGGFDGENKPEIRQGDKRGRGSDTLSRAGRGGGRGKGRNGKSRRESSAEGSRGVGQADPPE